ncbi:MAG: hypothetical protein ACRD5R_15045 [Candidatus Acidiferrales bacterium]
MFNSSHLEFHLGLILSCAFFMAPFAKTAVEKNPRASREAPQVAANSSSQAARTDLDTANWNTLKNVYGWQIKYPKNWYATANSDDVTTETSGLVEIGGPEGCPNAPQARCALIQIDPMIFQGEGISRLTPEEYLGTDKSWPDRLSVRKFDLGALPAVEVISLVKPGPGQTQLVCEVAAKHDGRILQITYIEQGKGQDMVKSPSDWKYAAVFDKMLTTFSFYK